MGNRLRVLRAERRLSQLRLARQSNIDGTRYWRIENDVVDPTREEKSALAAALGVSERAIWITKRTAPQVVADLRGGGAAI